ncbi:hypothetical protein CL617_05650 [archaeon]|nr:hypothetical protein [archaeon]|tara:strand:+ start:5121 stop:5309 length:189 start_codon:yes stop_codon:yes gene_type:complete
MKSYIFLILVLGLLISGCSSIETTDTTTTIAEADDTNEITEDINTSELDNLDQDFADIEEYL